MRKMVYTFALCVFATSTVVGQDEVAPVPNQDAVAESIVDSNIPAQEGVIVQPENNIEINNVQPQFVNEPLLQVEAQEPITVMAGDIQMAPSDAPLPTDGTVMLGQAAINPACTTIQSGVPVTNVGYSTPYLNQPQAQQWAPNYQACQPAPNCCQPSYQDYGRPVIRRGFGRRVFGRYR